MKKITLLTLFISCSLQLNAQTALDFDPAAALGDQQVTIPDITCPTEFTIEAWVYFRGDVDEYPTIIEFGDDKPFFGLRLISGDYYLNLYDIIYDINPFPVNQWVHIAISFSTINSEAKLYVNGSLILTETSVTLNISGVGAGIGFNNKDNVFNGMIDDVRIWNVVRTDGEISANQSTCHTGSETGLHALYNMDEGSGSTVGDATSNNFDGTLTNMEPATDWVSFDSCSVLSNNTFDAIDLTRIYPNPTSHMVTVKLKKFVEDVTISLYNLSGQLFFTKTYKNTNTINLSINGSSGLYFINVESEKSQSKTFRVLKH